MNIAASKQGQIGDDRVANLLRCPGLEPGEP